jgi:3-hydroxyisobutyrate dehydrogenase
MLFDTDATLAVTEEIVASIGADAIWIQSGTLGPDGARRVAGVASTRMLDAPVLGTKKPAEDGNLVVLVSGPAELIETGTPVFDAIGTKTVVAGDEIGQASALKLVVNAWIGLLTAGTAQSLAFASALGIDPALFLTAIDGAPVNSPYAQLKGAAMIARDWTTSFAVDGVTKDVGLMIDAAHGVNFPTALLEVVHSLFERASAGGHGADDMASVRTAFDGS